MTKGASTNPGDRDLFTPSLFFVLSVCLVAVAFRNLGWDTRAFAGRLRSTAGHVLMSVDDGVACTKGGGCSPMYRTTVGYDGRHGERVFSMRWGKRYAPGESVTVEHAIGRPDMARIFLTADLSGGLGSVLTTLCGLAYPVLFGSLIMLMRALVLGARPDRRVVLVWLLGASVATPLVWLLYWY